MHMHGPIPSSSPRDVPCATGELLPQYTFSACSNPRAKAVICPARGSLQVMLSVGNLSYQKEPRPFCVSCFEETPQPQCDRRIHAMCRTKAGVSGERLPLWRRLQPAHQRPTPPHIPLKLPGGPPSPTSSLQRSCAQTSLADVIKEGYACIM